jgi:hypothetical protein
MRYLDLFVNLISFLYEALVSYAATDEGKSHLAKIESDLALLPVESGGQDIMKTLREAVTTTPSGARVQKGT